MIYGSDLLNVVMFINKKHQTSGQLYGYRCMRLKCIQNDIRTERYTQKAIIRWGNVGTL